MQIRKNSIYQLGVHKLACGDARDTELVKKLVREEKISLVLSDTPYGVGYVESKDGFSNVNKPKKIINDHQQSDDEYRQFTKEWIEVLLPHIMDRNSFYIFNSDKMLFALREGMKDAGVKFAQLLVWVKNHSVLGRMDYLPQHELIVYGWFGKHKFYKTQDKSVIFYPRPSKSPLHPTMKPVGLLRKLILNSSKIGGVVFDSFGGSGSTLIAAEQTKRRCFMVEIDPEYCKVIIERFQKVTGKKAERIKQ